MTKSKRFIALAVVFAMVFAMAFSVLFIVREENHECTGVDCHICQQINAGILQFNHHTPKPHSAVYLLTVTYALVLLLGSLRKSRVSNTPISLKVKLSD